jgi:hypothetical protein
MALGVDGAAISSYYCTIGGLLHLLLESRGCNTSRALIISKATPADNNDWIEQHSQPKQTKKSRQEECKIDSDWPEGKEDKLENG